MSRSEQFRTLIDESGKKYVFNPPALSSAITNKVRKENAKLQGNNKKPHKAYRQVDLFNEIEDKYGIPESTLKSWKQGYNGIGDIDTVKKVADALGVDYTELLDPLEHDEKEHAKLNDKEIELIDYIYKELVECGFEYNIYETKGDTFDERYANRRAYEKTIKEKCMRNHATIDMASVLVSSEIKGKLHGLISEFAREGYKSDRWEDISGIDLNYPMFWYWNCDDREALFKNPEEYNNIELDYLISDEIEWAEEMGIYDCKPIDDRFDELIDKRYHEKTALTSSEIEELMEYGFGSIYNYATPPSPRDVNKHKYCQLVQMVIEHDIPELEDIK